MTPELSLRAERWDTSRLTIRSMAVDDVAALQMFMLDERQYTLIGGCPANVDELTMAVQRWVAGTDNPEARWFNWVVIDRAADEVIGTLQLTATYASDRWNGEIAYVIGVPFQGFGYATEMASSLLDKMAAAGFDHAYAHVLPGHTASEQVVHKIGLKPVDSFHDQERLWIKPLSDAPSPT